MSSRRQYGSSKSQPCICGRLHFQTLASLKNFYILSLGPLRRDYTPSLLGSLVAKRKGIFVARQNAESEFGTDGSGLGDKPNPNENNSYQTDSDCDSDDEESQGPLKRANFGYWS